MTQVELCGSVRKRSMRDCVEWITKSVLPGDSNAKLAVGEDILNNFIVEDCHKEGASKAAESSTNAKGADTGEIVGMFMKGIEAVSRKGIMDRRRELVV